MFRLSSDDLVKAAITALKIQHTWAAPEASAKRITVWDDLSNADRICSISSDLFVCYSRYMYHPLNIWDIQRHEKIFTFPDEQWAGVPQIWLEFTVVNKRTWHFVFSESNPQL